MFVSVLYIFSHAVEAKHLRLADTKVAANVEKEAHNTNQKHPSTSMQCTGCEFYSLL